MSGRRQCPDLERGREEESQGKSKLPSSKLVEIVRRLFFFFVPCLLSPTHYLCRLVGERQCHLAGGVEHNNNGENDNDEDEKKKKTTTRRQTGSSASQNRVPPLIDLLLLLLLLLFVS